MRRLLFILLLFFSGAVYGQFEFVESNTVNRNEINILFVPHYVAFGGLRVDIERINARKGWTIGPQVYYLKRKAHPITYGNTSLEKLTGIGLAIDRKFIKTSTVSTLGFWAVGLNTAYFYTEYYTYAWIAKQLYDQTVYDYQVVHNKGGLLRLEVNATIGIEKIYWNFMHFQPYMGIGYRYTIPFLGENQDNPFDAAFSFGYSGPVFILGLKLGAGKSFVQNQF